MFHRYEVPWKSTVPLVISKYIQILTNLGQKGSSPHRGNPCDSQAASQGLAWVQVPMLANIDLLQRINCGWETWKQKTLKKKKKKNKSKQKAIWQSNRTYEISVAVWYTYGKWLNGYNKFASIELGEHEILQLKHQPSCKACNYYLKEKRTRKVTDHFLRVFFNVQSWLFLERVTGGKWGEETMKESFQNLYGKIK